MENKKHRSGNTPVITAAFSFFKMPLVFVVALRFSLFLIQR